MIDAIDQFMISHTTITNITVAVCVWIFGLPVLRILLECLVCFLFSEDIPASKACIPARLPHPNPAGSAVLFEVPLKRATDDQICAFMQFRGLEEWSGLDAVVYEAAAYKGELYEQRTMKWIDDHFRRKLPNLQYPYVARHWNGWSSFWLETAPQIRKMCIASLILTVEHLVTGLILPAMYLRSKKVVFFDMSMYGEIGFQMVSCAHILASFYLERDVTIEQMHKAVWPLLLVHHICTIFLCVLSLSLGDSCPREGVCQFLFALLGLTSTLHYLGQIMDFSPISQANTPYLRMANHLFTLVAMIWFRCIYWVKISFFTIEHAAQNSGNTTAVLVALVLLLFSAFNFDFVKFHLKATRGCWKKIVAMSKSA
mmetsp:Transcript_18430/g.53144  ORF Transcript_18430/g.53144 Transcript_18430/m.53144 type:complete len:370 (-) Transcript_18430:64-1173(-)|eukprot:CAMPEP_0113560652 /NCGR_PEP_ID=MMETSP0015_2-20120614/19547_1 /TAXON_ID=2838 /ORGANISM="Odontella" /LENGTH=369 /DNA_ID=CAMNT_0000462375 /DNA_START=113 /DNA_END=1222 /DNA_ORIENTATION=- /assembly_acc=CAM_ASM_000160